MVGKDDDGDDGEGLFFYLSPECKTQAVDVFRDGQQGLPLVGNQGEEIAATRLLGPTVLHGFPVALIWVLLGTLRFAQPTVL